MLLPFKKGMFSWSYEKQLVVDGKGLPIVALDVLPQPPSEWPGKGFKMRVPNRSAAPHGGAGGSTSVRSPGGVIGSAQGAFRTISPSAADVANMATMMAFSSQTHSFIVALTPPLPRMLFKIAKPDDPCRQPERIGNEKRLPDGLTGRIKKENS